MADARAKPAPSAEERAAELEFLLRLNREADAFLSNCQGEGRPLDESVQTFLERMAPRAGAVGGAVRVSPGARVNLVRVTGLDEELGRRLLRNEKIRDLDGVVSRFPLEVGKLKLGELLLVFPESLKDKADARTEILAQELDGAVLSLSEVEVERELRQKIRALEKPVFLDDGRFGKYSLVKLLGQGGMAQVHLARVDGPSGVARLCALKRMLPHLSRDGHLTAMFLDEARVASLVNHPHVARVEDFGELGGTYYMALEFLAGVDSASLVDTAYEMGGIPVPYALALASQIATGLHAAHELTDLDGRPLGLVHRDVSPQNVMVTFDGVAKLVDFGVAKSQVQREQTRDTAVKGKLCYMSPEQCLGRTIDRRSDVFALGAVLYEFIAGRPLFLRDNDGATLRALLDEPVPRISKSRAGVGEELWRIVQRALARNPDERYPTALHLSSALDGYLKATHGAPSTSEIGAWLRTVFPGKAEEIAGWTTKLDRMPTEIIDKPRT
ncbi:MAG: serine/threonine protein kinase [Deltaproteobacteria bacterium]|nr:serine/threonine protein kinase [Deltaproteobacteria bacterium]